MNTTPRRAVGLQKLSLCVAIVAASLACASARADVRLPQVIGDNMVLQRDKPLPIWGKAEPGEEVTVELAGNKATATADKDGRWSVSLPAMKATADPLTMTVTGKNKLEIKNILVGEVWICSGQSNMQMAVANSDGAKEGIAESANPNIRLFNVPLHEAGAADDEIADAAAAPVAGKPAAGKPKGPARKAAPKIQWNVCGPQSVPGFSAVGYYFGRELNKELKVPVGLIANSWGGRRIEPFTPPAGFDAIPDLKKIPNDKPSAIYNAMVHPLVPFAIRGAVWYQGESNHGDGMLYYVRMQALIAGWRKVWGQGDFPFYFVQIAPLGNTYPNDTLPNLWEGQTAALKIPNTGMVVTTDIGNLRDIHPRNKKEVGRRLSLWALARTYGQNNVEPSGPLFKSIKLVGDHVRVEFTHVGDGLQARDGKPLTEFEIAGADGKFVPATAAIDGTAVMVHADGVTAPTQVRFGWRREANPNLTNKAGLPAAPFRSKDWKGGTAE